MNRLSIVVAVGLALSAAAAEAGPPSEVVSLAGFGRVSIYAPAAAPEAVVLFVSGDGGWNLGVVPMAERLRDQGALVVGIDIRAFIATLDAAAGCAYPAGSLEELSRAMQQHRHLREYKRPVLVGYSSGATLVYAAIAAAPPETFAGALSLGFCPDLQIRRPPCRQGGLEAARRPAGDGYDLAPNRRLRVPWMVLQGDVDQVCAPAATRAFVAAVPGGRLFPLPKVGHGFAVPRNWEPQFIEAFRAIVSRVPADPPAAAAPAVRDLALVEVPTPASVQFRDVMAILLTGDGGWSTLDRELATGLAQSGIPTVGWSSLRYFWTPRIPESAAADLARIISYYTTAWKVHRVVLVGYSFGADVLPFLANRLPPDLVPRVQAVALLGLSDTAVFVFQVASWFGGGDAPTYPTAPEVARLPMTVLCIHGMGESGSGCTALTGAHVKSAAVGQGHHFSGDYARLVEVIRDVVH